MDKIEEVEEVEEVEKVGASWRRSEKFVLREGFEQVEEVKKG